MRLAALLLLFSALLPAEVIFDPFASRLRLNPRQPRGFSVGVDGGSSAIPTGVLKTEVSIPYACTITDYVLLLHESGSAVLDIWKAPYANYPATVANTITASAKPTVSAGLKACGNVGGTGGCADITTWTRTVAAGDTIRVNVDSAATTTAATLRIGCAR